jgi:hypothetical protein
MFCEMETKTGIEVFSLLLILVVAIIIRTSATAATVRFSFEYNAAADCHGAIRQLL